MSGGRPLLEVRNLVKYFHISGGLFGGREGVVRAVDDVSFTIHGGETLGLLRSVPRLDEPRRARLDPIEGQPPDLTRLPAGCAFAARCAFRVERCARDRPGLVGVGAGDHVSACWETERLDRALATR